MSCRYYGISRQAYYIRYRRYLAEGADGCGPGRTAKTSPNATHVDVVGKILHLRQNYHFGPEKIAMYLKRYHDITISKSGVWRIPKRLNISRLPASQRGHHVQIDVKFIEPVAGVTGQRGGRSRARIDALVRAAGASGVVAGRVDLPRHPERILGLLQIFSRSDDR
jgi:hypothetical protein